MLLQFVYNTPMDDTKQKILDAASALFLQGGAAALSVRSIAARAGLSTMGIYSHFRGKQGILDALYIEGFAKVEAAMTAVPGELSGKEQVLQACRNYLNNAERHEAHYRLIFGDRDKAYQPSAEAIAVAERAFKALTRNVACILPQEADASIRRDSAIRIWSVVHGFVGLKQHLVNTVVGVEDWQDRALDTVAAVIEHIQAKHP